MSQPIGGRAAILVFRSARKHKLGRGRWDLKSIQVSLNWVPWFRKRNRNCFIQSEAGRPSWFADRLEKHKLGIGRWNLTFSQVPLNSVKRFQRRIRKCFIQWEAGRPSWFADRPEKKTHKNYELGRGRWGLASWQVPLNSVKRFQRRSRKCLSQSEAGRLSWSSDRPEKHKLSRIC